MNPISTQRRTDAVPRKTSGAWQVEFRSWLEAGCLPQILPEVAALAGVPQSPEYHAEGDVLTHTRLAVEAIDPDADQRVFWAVLLHDIGKAQTTRFKAGRWRAHGHDRAGAELVPGILARFGLDPLAEDVAWLVKHHGFMLSWGEDLGCLSARQRRFCAQPLFDLLVEVARADADASYGSSTKRDRLQRILDLRRGDRPLDQERPK